MKPTQFCGRKAQRSFFIEIAAAILLVLLFFTPVSTALVFYYQYDENGNLLRDERQLYEYDSFNNLVKVRAIDSGRILAEYTYDEEGSRIKKVAYPDGQAVTTYYPSPNLVRVVDTRGKTSDTLYIYDESTLIASQNATGTLFYHSNHLGSPEITTDTNRKVVEKISYAPFGDSEAPAESRFLFTGKEKDRETSLLYYGARYYNPSTGRFTQPDTYIQDPYDPQLLNRYVYARNNPQKYIDPSGNWIESAIDIGFIIWDIHEIQADPRSWEKWTGLGLDIVSTALPGVAGLGAFFKAYVTKSNKGKSLLNAGEKVTQARKAEKGRDAASAARTSSDAEKGAKNDLSEFMKDPAFRSKMKEIKKYEENDWKGGEFRVSSMDEAQALARASFPDYKQTFAQLDTSPSNLKPQEKGTYRIENLGPTGTVPGHGGGKKYGNKHADRSHINILTKRGNKIDILVDNPAK